MKGLFLTLITVISISWSESTAETTKTNTDKNTFVEKESIQVIDKLIGTWFVKDILINGKSDPENFPVKNDELTLKQDMTVITIDKSFDMEERGTWERVSDDQFAVITEEGRVVFQFLKLTD